MDDQEPGALPQAAFVYRVVVCTLAAVLLTVVIVMLVGLFDDKVDNAEIFKVIGPAFQMVVGCFVGLLGGTAISRSGK